MATKVYSFLDHKVVVNYPALGRYNLSNGGIGKITVAFASELASVTASPSGAAIINRKHRKDGTVAIEVPQVGEANNYLDKWSRHAAKTASKNFASATITITDTTTGHNIVCRGCAPQKQADVVYDEESQTRSWTFVCAEVSM